MDSSILMTVILLVGLLIGMAATYLIEKVSINIDKIKAILRNNKAFKEKQAEVDKMKEAGGLHEWVSIPSGATAVLACKKTGWCPSLQGFLSIQYIEAVLDAQRAEEEYKLFRDARVLELSEKLNVSFLEMEKVVEQVFSIKKDFTLLRLERLSKELKEKAAVLDGKES